MARTPGALGKRSIVTNDRFEHYLAEFGDPLELMFRIMANKLRKPRGKPRIEVSFADQAQAAKELLPYGYSKKMQISGESGDDHEYIFTWEQDDLFSDENQGMIINEKDSNTVQAPGEAARITQESETI